ncbi:recombinase family protein [Salinibacterium soli]|uniref:recombinase family protein n=1 Tax=Antiquaquibacter soli TaxID=3064523 RepID=UPI0034E441CD
MRASRTAWTPPREAFTGLLAVIAKVERRFIQRRTRSGLADARAQGCVGGRPRPIGSKKAALDVGLSDADIAKTLGVSAPTIYRYLNAAR